MSRPPAEQTLSDKILSPDSSIDAAARAAHDKYLRYVQTKIYTPQPTAFKVQDLFYHIVDFSSSPPPNFELEILYDDAYGLPMIKEVHPSTAFYSHHPARLRRNIWLVAVQDTEPISATEAYKTLRFHILEQKETAIIFILCKRTNPNRTNLQILRATFDQFRQYPASKHIPSASYAITHPCKPMTPRSIKDFDSTGFKIEWKKSLFEAYTKNARAHTFTAPFPIEEVPPNTCILRSVVAFRVKSLGHDHYDLYSRHCADGSRMIKGLDNAESYAAFTVIDSLCIGFAIAGQLNLHLYVIDIKNAFQTTLLDPSERLYLYLPPFYLEWFKNTYPHHSIPPAKTIYILQSIHAVQGTKPAGKQFHDQIVQLFYKLGFKQNATDNAVFICIRGVNIILLFCSTDDFLVMVKDKADFIRVKDRISQSYDLTTQEGMILNYLNLQIIQSAAGISIDQTKHILEMVEPHFPKGSSFTHTDTPFWTDKSYETELLDAIPATPAELQLLEKEYGGSFATLYGQLLHVSTISRPDISYAMMRLGRFQSGPCKLGFEGLRKVFSFLASRPNIPIMYTKQSTAHTLLTYIPNNQPPVSDKLPHSLAQMDDANDGTDLYDRKSISIIQHITMVPSSPGVLVNNYL